jgi:diadenylate cyclase
LLASLPNLDGFLTALGGVSPWQFLLEIVLIGVPIYFVIRFLQGTRGARVLKGIVVVLITLYLAVRILGGLAGLERLDVLFSAFLFYASFAILIVFQPELRRALMRLGETRLLRGGGPAFDEVEQLCRACGTLGRRKVGALIALARDDGLNDYTKEATPIDATVTSALLTTIFHPNTALHDLGVVIREGRIAFAGVQFPLAESGDLPGELGSRHRAAVGLSEETDAVVVVVSEETGDISIAVGGTLQRKLSVEALQETIEAMMNLGGNAATMTKPSSTVKKTKKEPEAEPDREKRDPSLGGDRPTRSLRVDAYQPSKRRREGKPVAETKPVKPTEAPGPIHESKPVGGTTVRLPPTAKPDEAKGDVA